MEGDGDPRLLGQMLDQRARDLDLASARLELRQQDLERRERELAFRSEEVTARATELTRAEHRLGQEREDLTARVTKLAFEDTVALARREHESLSTLLFRSYSTLVVLAVCICVVGIAGICLSIFASQVDGGKMLGSTGLTLLGSILPSVMAWPLKQVEVRADAALRRSLEEGGALVKRYLPAVEEQEAK